LGPDHGVNRASGISGYNGRVDVAGFSFLNDIIFKIVFGAEANRALLRALLNALLELSGEDRIVELSILNPQVDKEYLTQKGAILDVRARDGKGRLYNIEVQVSDEPAYMERALYYLSRLFSGQLEMGEPYTQIAKTIGISLTDFVLFRDQADLQSTYRLVDEDHGRRFPEVLELHFIELVKFDRDKPRELRTPFERWLHVLKFGELYGSGGARVPEELQREEGIEMAVEALRKARSSDQVRELIEFRMKADRDEATRLERARLQGLEQGRQEALVQTIRRMRAAGATVEEIRRLTGLDPDELDPRRVEAEPPGPR